MLLSTRGPSVITHRTSKSNLHLIPEMISTRLARVTVFDSANLLPAALNCFSRTLY